MQPAHHPSLCLSFIGSWRRDRQTAAVIGGVGDAVWVQIISCWVIAARAPTYPTETLTRCHLIAGTAADTWLSQVCLINVGIYDVFLIS